MITKMLYKSQAGKTYEIKDIVEQVKWSTDLNFSAAQLDVTLIQNPKPLRPNLGGVVQFYWDKHKVFYGRIFKADVDHENRVTFIAYGLSRYLKNQDSIVWKTGTVAQRFTTVCKRAGIKHKVVKTPTHKVKAEVSDGKTYFDMIKSAITDTFDATGHMYFIYDNFNTVELRRAPYKKLKLIVGSKSGMTGYKYSKDINNAANVVRIVNKSNTKSQKMSATAKSKGKGKAKSTATGDNPKTTRFSFVSAKGKSTKDWGTLQIVENRKNKENQAQMKARAKELLKSKNQANKTLTIDCIGNLNLVAGNAVTVNIKDTGLKIPNCPIIKAVHTFNGAEYSCSLTMKAGKKWLENT